MDDGKMIFGTFDPRLDAEGPVREVAPGVFTDDPEPSPVLMALASALRGGPAPVDPSGEAFNAGMDVAAWEAMGTVAPAVQQAPATERATDLATRCDDLAAALEPDADQVRWTLQECAARLTIRGIVGCEGCADSLTPADRLSLIADLVSGLPHDSNGTVPYLVLGRNAEAFDLIKGLALKMPEGLVNGDYATVRLGGMWFEAKQPTEGKR